MIIEIKRRFSDEVLLSIAGADLQGAYLRGAYLRDADLRGANLQGAYLQGAYLQGANLRGVNLQGAQIPIFCKWAVTQIGTTDIIKIGCKQKSIAEWVLFFAGKEEYDTKRGSTEFKQIEANFKAFEAYYNHLNS